MPVYCRVLVMEFVYSVLVTLDSAIDPAELEFIVGGPLLVDNTVLGFSVEADTVCTNVTSLTVAVLRMEDDSKVEAEDALFEVEDILELVRDRLNE